MSTSYISKYTRSLQYEFQWNEVKSRAAELLAYGYNKQYVADQVEVSRMTIHNWLNDPDFAAEVDRLSLMVGIASRAQRLRWLNKTIANKINEDGSLQTDKDVVDLIKIAISETDGAKIDLSKLAELLTGESEAIDVTPSHQQQLSQPAEPLAPHLDVVPDEPQTTTDCIDQPPSTTPDIDT